MVLLASSPGLDVPDVDDRLVTPETRYEMVDGELAYVSPAKRPHGTRHAQLASLLEAHVDAAFDVAVDMLTRTSRVDDIAPDASVFPDAPDPATGKRQLEQIAFEIVATQSLGAAAVKARKLSGRGVRRVFAIDVERSRAFEWSAEADGWSALDAAGRIVDPALAVPLPIEPLIHAARTNDAVASALIAQDNPVIAATRERDRAEGKAEGKAEALLVLLTARGLAVDGELRDRIRHERDPARLERWIVRGATCATIGELLDDE